MILCLGYVPPHRNQVQRKLKELYAVEKSRLIETLKSVKSISLTADFWTDRHQNSFLCITGHYMDDLKLHSTVLHYQSYKRRHLASNIAEEIYNCLQELGIGQKVTSVTADGAANMTSAFDSFTNVDRFWCVAHRFHLTLCNGLLLWKKYKKSEDESNKDNSNLEDALNAKVSFKRNHFDNMDIDERENQSNTGNYLYLLLK